jgi:hypothetical protein
MAQRVNSLSLRLGLNLFWSSQWYSNSNYETLFLEDILIKTYLKNIFENRGFFFKRALIKRAKNMTFIFLEIYGNPYFKYSIPKPLRHFKKFQKVLKIADIENFLKKLSKSKVYLGISNVFIFNRIHRNFFKRLQGQFHYFKRFKFCIPILGVFSVVLRTKGAAFFCRVLANELELLERKKKNKDVWRLIAFIGKLVKFLKYQNKAIHGIRIQLKGRFKGIKRPKKIRFREGMVPFNTFRALIDYSYETAISVNGSFGLKVWICYK